MFSRLLGYRWSLYLVQKPKNLLCYMGADNAQDLLIVLGMWFCEYGAAIQEYEFVLNFNKTHQTCRLKPEHFDKLGDPTDELLHRVVEIDSDAFSKSHLSPDALTFRNATNKKKVGRDEIIDWVFPKKQ